MIRVSEANVSLSNKIIANEVSVVGYFRWFKGEKCGEMGENRWFRSILGPKQVEIGGYRPNIGHFEQHEEKKYNIVVAVENKI